MAGWTAYLNGRFVAAEMLSVPVEDLGFLQGVAISERLRTFNGSLFRLNEHLQRLENSLRIVQLEPGLSHKRIGDLIQEVVSRNRPLLSPGDDLGVSLFVTPGSGHDATSTVGIEAYPLPFEQWVEFYERGQALTETGVRQVPSSCWPAALKCRSRMHYYLADQQAQQRYPGSRAILLDQDGFVSEASTANIVIRRKSGELLSPPLEKILPGVSLAVLAELATALDIPFCHDDFQLEEVVHADEVLLCSTSPCVWPATRLNGRPIGTGECGPVYRRLLAAWNALVGLDIAAQARRFARR